MGNRRRPANRAAHGRRPAVLAAVIGAVLLVGCVTPVSTVSSSAPQTSPSPAPGSAITGEVPPSDARAPAGTSYIPDLQAEVVWNALTAIGFACRSTEGAYPDAQPPGWAISCERIADGAETTVTAPYWAFDRVVAIHVTVLPDPIDTSVSATISREAFDAVTAIAYTGADLSAAREWAGSRANLDVCLDTPCQRALGLTRLSVQSGLRGSGSLTIDGAAVVDD
jgi:hypothetical protein